MPAPTFDPAAWAARFPEFAAVAPAVATELYAEAQDFPMGAKVAALADPAQAGRLLNLLTAHLAFLSGYGPGASRAGIVGRIASAGEGSVSASFDMGPASASSAWFMQSPYGAQFWAATAGLRLGFYAPGPRPALGFGVSRAH